MICLICAELFTGKARHGDSECVLFLIFGGNDIRAMNNCITIRDMIELMNSGATFDIQVVTLDQKRNTGGKRIILKNCIKTGSSHATQDHGTVTVYEQHRRNYNVTAHTSLIEKINGRDVL